MRTGTKSKGPQVRTRDYLGRVDTWVGWHYLTRTVMGGWGLVIPGDMGN